jgi:hypothetical protein
LQESDNKGKKRVGEGKVLVCQEKGKNIIFRAGSGICLMDYYTVESCIFITAMAYVPAVMPPGRTSKIDFTIRNNRCDT